MTRRRCSVHGCEHPAWDDETPHCRDHIAIPSFVRNDQLAMARSLLKRGATLYQAAMRVRADPRDLDLALWNALGRQRRPEGQF